MSGRSVPPEPRGQSIGRRLSDRSDMDVHQSDLQNSGAVTARSADAPQPPLIQLRNWMLSPRRIGGARYRGECIIARVRQATYQQQSTTHGSSAGVFGLSSDGRGLVTGGGGFVTTAHRGMVSAVLEDETGRHVTQELPPEMALLEGGILRLDLINGTVVCATNLTGRQGPVVLLGPSAFISSATFTKRHAVLMIATVLMAGQILSAHPIAGLATTAAFAALPFIRLRQIQRSKRERTQLKDYMLEVMS
jgi:hypothetical protein